jgi:hypothetical protein
MIPIAHTVFWGPMAYAVIGGLLVATLLTLVFLPALYVAWFRIQPPQESEPSSGSEGHPHSKTGKVVSRLKEIPAVSAPALQNP